MKKLLATLVLLCVPLIAFAYDSPTTLVGTAMATSMTTISNELQTLAIRLLFSFLVLQWVIDGFAMLGTDTDISVMIGKLAKAVLWAAFCLWLLDTSGTSDGLSNLGHFMRSTINYFLVKASEWSGGNGASFDSIDILEIGLVAYGKITIAVIKTTATNVVNLAAMAVPGMAFITALMVFATSAIIIACCAYISLKVFLVKLQIAIFICMSPLSVAMLGLKGLREQGFAPLKAMLGLVYRIIILAAIVSTMKVVADNFAGIIDQQAVGIAADIWTPILGGMFGFILLAFLTHKADDLAASLASGSITMGTGDLSSSIATGVAAGMTGGAAMAAMQSAMGGKGMLDTLKNLAIPKLGASNATPANGSGGAVGDAPKKSASASMSKSESSQVGSGADGAEGAVDGGVNTNSDGESATSNTDAGGMSTPVESSPKPEFAGVPNQLPDENARDPARDAARAERRAATAAAKAKPLGSGEDAGIGGKPPTFKDALKTFGQQAGQLNQHLANDKAAMHISIDHRHHD